ncbi:MAG TPA: glutamate 5-kinase [Pseudobdellovibrionaceae bacterium]|nr:glutamate 5-kinase [Pseudobdellovibrionaceae bacterium]
MSAKSTTKTSNKIKTRQSRQGQSRSPARQAIKNELWVIKIGSSVLIDGGPLLLRALVQDIHTLQRKHKIQIVWVTSGAIATAKTQLHKTWKTVSEKQALSAIGQPILMDIYNQALLAESIRGAQVLLTSEDMKRPVSRTNLLNTLKTLLKWKIVPILNENDAVATDEIKFGDNDALSAQVAQLLGADRLLILTNVQGLYTANPAKDRFAQLIEYLPKVSTKILETAMGRSQHGTGGMLSKLRAAQIAQKKNIATHIIKGDASRILVEVAEGHSRGTQIGGRYIRRKQS